ncbi:MAG TPA: methyltransferase domain-containing protein [Solimonas sp.]|nr:methyltransferase domain-containing protein [Solimonas sp.]
MSEIELHRKLLGDAPRNAAFHEALRRVIVPGKTTVLDIGAGTGFLSFLAQRLGAKQCTLVEYSDALELAEQLARRNRIDGLSFLRGHSMELKRALKVDVVVTETLGNFALEEGFLETAVDARRFLKPKGVVIPGRLRQFVAPVFGHRLQRDLDIWPAIGFGLDFAPARTISLSNMYVKPVLPADLGPDTLTQCWDDLDLRPDRPAPNSRRSRTLQWKASALPAGRIEGFALWWEAELVDGVTISTSPHAPPTHWEQIYLPLLQPAEPGPGDQLELTLSCDTRPEVGVRLGWKTRVLSGSKVVSEQVQDSFRGRL